MLRLVDRRPPHGDQLVADVIDENAAVGQNAVGQLPHHVADPVHGPRRAEPLADPAESADIAEQDRDVGVMAVEEVGAEGELFGKLAGEELLEGCPRLARRRARERGAHRSGEELHQLRLQRRDRAPGDDPLARPDAIENADHVIRDPEDR